MLWLSRSKLDRYAQEHNDWSAWRDVRHILNEPSLTSRLSRGLETFSAKRGYTYRDGRNEPEAWSSPELRSVRFAVMDPTVHALETQVHLVGHASILLSSHGGALGLSLFMPPGEGALVELQVDTVKGNYHFQHMATEMGVGYEMVGISRDVDVEHVWEVLEKWVEKLASS